jgi:ABC-type sugar transport system ATPase subunit
LGVLLISSDLTEVLGASDRVLVMHEGRLVADLPSAETDEENLLAHSIGVAA